MSCTIRRACAKLSKLVGALALGAATAVAISWWLAVRWPECGGGIREAIRFPEPPTCGVRVRRADSAAGFDLRAQTGMIIVIGHVERAGAAEVDALVPEWARDRLVAWGWTGGWQVGRWSCRRLAARGWPWPALASVMEATVATPFDPPQDFGGWHVVEGIDGSSSRLEGWLLGAGPSGSVLSGVGPRSGPPAVSFALPGVLPSVVLWPGMLANVAFFAIPWWLLLGALARLPAAVRHVRGRCARCGYDLRGHATGAPCPECGGES